MGNRNLRRHARIQDQYDWETRCITRTVIVMIVCLVLVLLMVFQLAQDVQVRQRRPQPRGPPAQPGRLGWSTHYGVVFDLGSSGSRAHVFTWHSGPGNGCLVLTRKLTPSPVSPKLQGMRGDMVSVLGGLSDMTPMMRPGVVATLKQKPGVSSFAEEPDAAGRSLEGLFDFVEDWVPEEERPNTPVYLFATAGLRVLAHAHGERIYDDDEGGILEEDDEDFGKGRVARILASIRKYVREETPFTLEREDQARVLTGEEEGLFDFLSVQQLLSASSGSARLDLADGRPVWDLPRLVRDDVTIRGCPYFSVGTIDLGGASTQVSYVRPFKPPDTLLLPEPHETEISQARNFVFTHSFLDYGIHRAHERHVEHLLALGRPSDPCTPRGFHVSNTMGSFSLEGTGNAQECEELIGWLFSNSPGPCKPEEVAGLCAMELVQRPKPRSGTRFLVFDHGFRVASFLGLAGFPRLESIREAATTHVTSSAADVREAHPSENDDALALYGFESMYLFHLLHTGYGFDNDSEDVGFAETLGSSSLDWSLGAMVSEANLRCQRLQTS